MRRTNALFVLLFCLPCLALAQEDADKVSTFKDSLDGKMDFSRFLIEFNGFIPIVTIITEPAVGGFGAGIGPIFLTQKKDGRK